MNDEWNSTKNLALPSTIAEGGASYSLATFTLEGSAPTGMPYLCNVCTKISWTSLLQLSKSNTLRTTLARLSLRNSCNKISVYHKINFSKIILRNGMMHITLRFKKKFSEEPVMPTFLPLHSSGKQAAQIIITSFSDLSWITFLAESTRHDIS